ncbi:MAG: penicillin-binding transpeptidase domain-containing protein, partial [Candidatus Zipacnadales bacterium]
MKQSVLATNIKRLAFLTLLAFCVMPLGVGYWAVLRAQDLKQNPHNRRAEARLERTKPGRVYSREGEEILGRTRDKQGSSWQRTYPSPHTYCHLTGYNHRTGLQLSLRQFLLEPVQWFDPLYVLTDPEPVGNDVMLTIDAGAQALAQRLLQGRKGAIVALNPSTGEVLVLASAPTYNPTEVVRDPEAQTLFTTNPDAPELFRAVQGLYPPGSIFKVMTTAAALERGEVSVDTQYTCTGSIT